MTTTPATVSPRNQLFFDLFSTALEGGIGYWSQASVYHWTNDQGATYDLRGFRAVVREYDETTDLTIDRSVIARGYALATDSHSKWRNTLAWSSGKPPVVITADTDWDFDAGDADMVVQLGLFGEVVYG
jgi:hypothetical protein